jgi:hypothetical protein
LNAFPISHLHAICPSRLILDLVKRTVYEAPYCALFPSLLIFRNLLSDSSQSMFIRYCEIQSLYIF